MAIIQIENLSFTYPGSYTPVFEQVNLQLDTTWKIGCIGRNGTGKTTFLKLLLKAYPYHGHITSSTRFDYFPYSVANTQKTTESVFHEVCPLAEDWECMRELSYLEVDIRVLERPFETLSKGEQTKVLLAALFLNPQHFLLIDEPTNHLDEAARAIMAAYLKKKKGFIVVSHDRAFLDGCIDHVLSFSPGTVTLQNGNLSSFEENQQRQQLYEQAQYKQLQKDVKRLQKAADRTAVWSSRTEASKTGAADKGFVGHKAAKMMKRAKTIEARQNKALEEKQALLHTMQTTESLQLTPLPYHAQTLAVFSQVSVCYHEESGCPSVSFSVQVGDRVLLKGKNGSGKSSLLELLQGAPIPYTGQLTIGSGLIISYVPQDTGHLQGSLADYARTHSLNESLLKAILRKMEFERSQFDKDMCTFSAGQKKKVLLARSLCEKAHLYVWDEPLNFIDMDSRRQIEQLICQFAPTMVLVEHDKAFGEAVATKIIELQQN